MAFVKLICAILVVMKKAIEIGNRLKALRGNISQRDMAKKIGIPFRSYQYYEYGDREPPTDVLIKILKVFRVTTDWILTGKQSTGYVHITDIPEKKEVTQMIRQLERIYSDGDKVKIDALKAQLKAFDPGEKKPAKSSKKTR